MATLPLATCYLLLSMWYTPLNMKRIHLLLGTGLVMGVILPTAYLLAAGAAGFTGPPCSSPQSCNVPGVIWNVAGTSVTQDGAVINIPGGQLLGQIVSDVGLSDTKSIRVDKDGSASFNMGNWYGGPSKPLTFTVYGGARAVGITANPVLGEDGRMQAYKFCFDPIVNGNPDDCITDWSQAGGGAPADVWVNTTGDSMTGQLIVNGGSSFSGGAAVWARNDAANGYGGYFQGSQDTGVYGWGGLVGVNGYSPGDGVRGTGFSGGTFYGNNNGWGVFASGPTYGVNAMCTNAACTGGIFSSNNGIGVKGTASNVGGDFTGTTYGAYGRGSGAGVVGVDQETGSRGSLGEGVVGVYGSGTTHGVYGIGTTYGVYGEIPGPGGLGGALGYQGYGVYSQNDIYSTGNKGVVLNAADRPLITRGHDPFTAGIYNGVGRWGMFMEAHTLVAGIPSIAGKSFKVSKYDVNSNKTDLMTVTEAGYVGIGTTNPRGGIDITTSPQWSSFNYGPDVIIAGPRNPSIAFLDSTGLNPWALVNSAGTMIFSTMPALGDIGTAPVNRMTLSTAGLWAAGNLTISGGTATKSVGTTWANPSDIRLKDVAGDYSRGLEEISQLQPINFTFKPDNAKGITDLSTHVGFSAQDVKKVIPEAISLDSQGYLQLNSDPIIWAMLNSIKELKAENDGLKARIEQLEAK